MHRRAHSVPQTFRASRVTQTSPTPGPRTRAPMHARAHLGWEGFRPILVQGQPLSGLLRLARGPRGSSTWHV